MENILNIHGIENIDKQYPGIMKEIRSLIFRSENGFMQGYTCACANLVRTTRDATGTHEVELLRASESRIKELRKAKCDEDDIKILMPTIKKLNRKRKTI